MAKSEEEKTNVMRVLEKAKIAYTPHYYEHGIEAVDGVSVAQQLGQNVETVYKTLVTQGTDGSYAVFVIPVAAELDLKKAAKSIAQKSVAMLHVADLHKVTGYVRGGCSPIGMKKQFTTVLDASANAQKTIMVSAGKIGAQIEIAPNDLLVLTRAQISAITL